MPDLDPRNLSALPTANGAVARLAHAHAHDAGVALAPLMRKAGLTERQIEDPDARLKVKDQIRFLNLVADAVGDPFLGFHLGLTPDVRAFGLLYYVAASSETLADALRRAVRYSRMLNEGVVPTYADGAGIRIAFDYVGVARHGDRHQIEFIMTALVRLCRHLTGLQLVPSGVRLTHHRGEDCAALAAFFGRAAEFGVPRDELALDAATAKLPLVSADPYLNQLLVAVCEQALARRPGPHGSFRAAVENAIVPLLPHGKARADEIARKLGCSQRSLARRLAREGMTFSEILEGLRRDLAPQYLADRGLSVSEIAWLLGYQESSAFAHAFRRWTGTTPRQARAA